MKIKSRGDRNLEEVLIIKEVVISSLVDLIKIRLYKKTWSKLRKINAQLGSKAATLRMDQKLLKMRCLANRQTLLGLYVMEHGYKPFVPILLRIEEFWLTLPKFSRGASRGAIYLACSITHNVVLDRQPWSLTLTVADQGTVRFPEIRWMWPRFWCALNMA